MFIWPQDVSLSVVSLSPSIHYFEDVRIDWLTIPAMIKASTRVV